MRWRCNELTQGITHAGDKGRILAIFYSPTSAFATTLAESVANGYVNGYLADFREISARNPPNIPKPEPICGRSHFCSKSSHCRGALSCICVADKWYGEFYTSTCKYPLPRLQNGRGVLEIASANATQTVLPINGNLTAENSKGSACPCNCTYVSKSCCDSLSGGLYEAPDLRLGSLQDSSADMTCNAATGDFQASDVPLDVVLTPRELDRKQN